MCVCARARWNKTGFKTRWVWTRRCSCCVPSRRWRNVETRSRCLSADSSVLLWFLSSDDGVRVMVEAAAGPSRLFASAGFYEFCLCAQKHCPQYEEPLYQGPQQHHAIDFRPFDLLEISSGALRHSYRHLNTHLTSCCDPKEPEISHACAQHGPVCCSAASEDLC